MSGAVSSEAAEGFDAPAARPPPLLVHLPPPVKDGAGSAAARIAAVLVLGSGGVLISVGLIFLVLGVAGPAAMATGIVLLSLGGAEIASYLLVRSVMRARRSSMRRWRERFLRCHPDWSDLPLATMLAPLWERRGLLWTKEIVKAVARSYVPGVQRACVVCCGLLEVPGPDDYRFEPVIIPPTRFLWRRLWFVPVALVIFALWLAQRTHVIPIPGNVPLSSFSYFLGMGVVMAALWVWRTTIRPTYLRLAPGVVQVVQYRFGQKKPAIRSYPVSSGTVAIVRTAGARNKIGTVALARGDRKDHIPLWQMRDSQQTAEALWRALLSTAPTPPLSDEYLLG